MPNIKLKSSDGVIFEIDIQAAKLSGTLKTMLEVCGMDEEGVDAATPLPNVNAAILDKVVQWLNHHKDDTPSQEDNSNKRLSRVVISPWDAEFLKVDHKTLCELMIAGHYLDIEGLVDVAAKTVANMITGKSPKAIRRMLGIVKDFTPVQKAMIRGEYRFLHK